MQSLCTQPFLLQNTDYEVGNMYFRNRKHHGDVSHAKAVVVEVVLGLLLILRCSRVVPFIEHSEPC